MLDVIVGTAPVNWNNRDVPGYRAPTPYLEMLDQMAAAGYAGTEYGEEFPRDRARVERDLTARGLKLASMFYALDLRGDDAARREKEIGHAVATARFLRSMGGDMLIVADSGDARRQAVAGRVDESVALDAASWRRMVEGFVELARRCAAHGVRVTLHNHVGTYVETEEELARVLDATDPDLLGLCYDIGHMAYAGGDVQRVVDRYGPRIRYVHLKDVDPAVLAESKREGLSFAGALQRGIFPELGAGMVDFPRFLAALDALDYAGWLIVEQDTTMKTPLESARLNREYLRATFGL